MRRRILTCMTNRLVGVDEFKLEEVRALLGTSTIAATVNRALEEVLALAARPQALLGDETVAGSADLADDEQRRAAWGTDSRIDVVTDESDVEPPYYDL